MISSNPERAVVFDVGEVLVDESRLWRLWADWLSVPHERFLAALDEVIARGESHRGVFDLVRPELAPFDVARARAARIKAGWEPDVLDERDLYDDVRSTLWRLHDAGYVIGLAGNQPREAEASLGVLDLPVALIASSESWGVAKPSPAFFDRVIESMRLPPESIAYVGDRLDNDVLPARAAGLRTVLVARGPWGRAHARDPAARCADAVIPDLTPLPEVLGRVFSRPLA